MNWETFSSADFARLNSRFEQPKLTEAEWLASVRYHSMIGCLPVGSSRRKLRLFACSSVRLLGDLVNDNRARKSLEAAEMFADALANLDELAAANQVAMEAGAAAWVALPSRDPSDWTIEHQQALACFAAADVAAAEPPAQVSISTAAGISEAYWNAHGSAQIAACDPYFEERQAAALRDLFGNPFRSVTADVSSLPSDARSLAEQMYRARDFQEMAHLEVILQKSGCADSAIADHCRADTEHFRGCWLIDLLTGRS
jgi:hypothetical protein